MRPPKELHIKRLLSLQILITCCLVSARADSSDVSQKSAVTAKAENVRIASPDDWPQFRGPGGQGHSNATGLPLTWSEMTNVSWKCEIEGEGWSSPVTRGKQLWVTTSLDSGRSLLLISVDLTTGERLQRIEIFAPPTIRSRHPKNSYASPTPILAGDRVYVHFGPYGTACLTTAGQIVWKTKLAHKTLYGPSSSPVLFKNLLIVQCHGTDVRYVTALDKNTGEVVWRRSDDYQNPQLDYHNAESTPLVIQTDAGAQLICNVAGQVLAYEPRTGNSLWSVQQPENYAQVPRPVYGNGLLFTAGGYYAPVLFAIRPEGRGDVTVSHVEWSLRKAVPQNPSPLLINQELYLVSDNGVASCLDARTGQVHWRKRLEGDFSTSPIFADGKIYVSNEQGVTTVLAPGTRFQTLATNKLNGRILASPAVSGKAIYLRTDRYLYCLEQNSE